MASQGFTLTEYFIIWTPIVALCAALLWVFLGGGRAKATAGDHKTSMTGTDYQGADAAIVTTAAATFSSFDTTTTTHTS